MHESNVCGDAYKVTIFGEYHELCLEEEIRRRFQYEELFSEAEIWYLAEGIISACAYMEERKIYHGDLSTE